MSIRSKIIFILTGITFLIGNLSFRFAPPAEQEYILKAAFLYRFSDYVEWENNNDETFNIGVLGQSGIVKPLVDISKGKKAKNKSIYIRQYNTASDLGPCQILFISRNYKYPIETVLSKLDYKPVLIITERDDDFDKGAHINFLISDNKLKFEVNLRTTSRSGLRISSQLLQHALEIKR